MSQQPSQGPMPSPSFPFQVPGNGRRWLLILWPSWPSCLGSRHARPSQLATLRPPSKQPHYPTSLVPWLGQVLPARLLPWQLHLQSQHIKDTAIMLLLQCDIHQKNYLPCASSSRLLTSTMSASAASSCRFSSANPSVRLATERLATFIKR